MLQIGPEERRGRTIGQVYAAELVEPDDPRGHTRQHSLGKPAALVELTVRLFELALLALNLLHSH